MIRCPACDSTDSTLTARLSVEPGRIADQRECEACGERWTLPAQSIDDMGGVECIELGASDVSAFDADDLEDEPDTDSVADPASPTPADEV